MQNIFRVLFLFFILINFYCMSMKVWDKAFPGAVPVEPEQIQSIDFGKDLTVRFTVQAGWQGLQERCFQFNKEYFNSREEIRVEILSNCEKFQLISKDIQTTEIKNTYGLLVLPSHINKMIDLRETDFYNYLDSYSYSNFPKMNLNRAEISSNKDSIFILNDKNQYIVVKRYEEWNKKILYDYYYLEKIEAPYLKFLSNTLDKNELEYPKEKNTKLPILPIQKPILVLYFNLDKPHKESRKMIFEISNFEVNNIYSLHLDMKSLYEGSAPWYLALAPFSVVFDLATFPFQAVYFVMYIVAKGSIHH